MAVLHQLVLVLQRVLEQGPYDGLQLRVGVQQVGAQHLQSGVGQAVHCRGETQVSVSESPGLKETCFVFLLGA